MGLTIPSFKFWQEIKSKGIRLKWYTYILLCLALILSGGIIYYLIYNYNPNIFHFNELREGLVGQPRFLNPLFSQDNDSDRVISHLIFQGLVRYDPETKQFVGNVADRYEITDEGKVYHFYLKDNLYFHDGQKLTMEDVIFTYSVIQYENYHGFWKEAFSKVKIDKVSDTELTMTLEAPLASFIEHNTVGIIPSHLFSSPDDALRPSHIFNVAPVGSGPYRYVKKDLSTDQKSVENLLLVNKSKGAKLPKIRFYFFNSETELTNAYKMGRIDAFGTTNSETIRDLKDWTNYQLNTLTLGQRYYGVFFNLQSEKKISEFSVREALIRGINFEFLNQQIFNENQVKLMNGPIETNSFAYDPEIKTYGFDVEKAKELIKDYKAEELSFTLTYPDTETNQKIAYYLQQAWGEIGVNIELKTVSIYSLRDAVIGPRNFEILLLGQEVSRDPDRYSLWHSTQINYPALNISQFKNRFVDKALEQGRKEMDPEKRKVHYKDFQRYFQNELPAELLYQPNYYYLISKRYAGKFEVKEMGLPEDRFDYLLYPQNYSDSN